MFGSREAFFKSGFTMAFLSKQGTVPVDSATLIPFVKAGPISSNPKHSNTRDVGMGSNSQILGDIICIAVAWTDLSDTGQKWVKQGQGPVNNFHGQCVVEMWTLDCQWLCEWLQCKTVILPQKYSENFAADLLTHSWSLFLSDTLIT